MPMSTMRIQIGTGTITDISTYGFYLVKSPSELGCDVKESNIVTADFPEESGQRLYIPAVPSKKSFDYTISLIYFDKSAGRNLIVGSNIDVTKQATDASFYCWLPLSIPLEIGKTYILSSDIHTGDFETPNLSDGVGNYSNGQPIAFNTPFTALYASRSIRIYHTNTMQIGRISNLKLESGNHVNGWSLAPEDSTNNSKINSFYESLLGKQVTIYNDDKKVKVVGYAKQYKAGEFHRNEVDAIIFDLTFFIPRPQDCDFNLITT